MPYQLQLSDARASVLKNIAGVCSESSAFVDLVNEAQRRLVRRGNFFGLEQVIRVLANGCIITWPRHVGTVLGVRFCNRDAITPSNHWWSYVGPMPAGKVFGGNIALEDAGTSPTANVINGDSGKLIRYYVVKQNDIGKTITLHGKIYGGQPAQEKDSDHVWQDGITLTATAPHISTSDNFTSITSVVREATEGMAYLYEYDTVTTALRMLAIYEPGETNPRYRVSRIQGTVNEYEDANGIHWRSIEALVKLAFIPVVNDRDFLLIDNLDALKFMIQAIKCEEANDDQTAEAKILKAVRELNFEDRDRNPQYQTPVFVNVTSGCPIVNPY